MGVDVQWGGNSGTRVAPPIFSLGKGHSAARAAVHAGGHESAAGVAANYRLVASGATLAAFINCFVMRHSYGNVNAYKLTLRFTPVSPCVTRRAPAQTVRICYVSG